MMGDGMRQEGSERKPLKSFSANDYASPQMLYSIYSLPFFILLRELKHHRGEIDLL